MTREQMIAHLVLHGWRPAGLMRDFTTPGEGTGLLHDTEGFVYWSPLVRVDNSPKDVRRAPKEWANVDPALIQETFDYYYLTGERNENRV